ncbi:cysteine-rich CWC family protein [Aridibaculum aurantiacum]|uniref:cysteine-rich CWC family protein n=1 Tax=Aridibaculum aurantiacum TaxID=2810307 RepID=UPI001A96001E|nr:cysteine-rich CWC family protein [Aridibaculum aurantiacum]
MGVHEMKTCPACKNTFECKANNIAHCQCTQVVLPVKVMDTIKKSYDDCLCLACLQQLVNDAGKTKDNLRQK